MSANSSMKVELMRHIKTVVEEQEAAGGPMLVGLIHQDVEEIAARLKQSVRYKMVGLDALKKLIKEVASKNLLNVAPQKEALVENGALGKREPEKDKTLVDGETGFLRKEIIIQLLRSIRESHSSPLRKSREWMKLSKTFNSYLLHLMKKDISLPT